MEPFLLICVVIIYAVLSIASVTEQNGLSICSVICGLVAIIVFAATSSGNSATLKINTQYCVTGVYPKQVTASSNILELAVTNWGNTYLYKVECNTIEGGCPSEWPSCFKVISNGEKNVVVPVKKTEEKKN